MQVITADAMGMCFGVRDALGLLRSLERPVDVTIMGQLVHNPHVQDDVRRRGFAVAQNDHAATDTILITAHGVSDRARGKWLAAGKRIVDATCPLVRRAHAAALALAREARFIVLCGKRGHVEVRGLTGDLPHDAFVIIEHPAEVTAYPHDRIAVMAQTTSVQSEVDAVLARVREKNAASDVHFVNTICSPTRDRQAALTRLLQRITTLVVIGGRTSNNTRQLAETARRIAPQNLPILQIEGPAELHPRDFPPSAIVGVTAGTSTLPETVDAVIARLKQFHPPS